MEEVFDKIKEYANYAKDEAIKFSKTVGDKTSNMLQQTKLKCAISKTEDKVKEIYAQMGGSVYEVYLKGTQSVPDLTEQCKKLDALYEEIEDMEKQLSELREDIKCPGCGTYNPISSEYCSKCGSLLRKVTEENTISEDDAEDEDVVEVTEDKD